ncbi:hypothetical protein Leryth_021975 [Lithospermum erythrorhizon]|nr:hypothetical protein Leryth_021975 [Lithospermum erythrorhizon]
MANQYFYFLFLLCLCLWHCFAINESTKTPPIYNRSSFPDGFIFGASSAAYQYEGGAFQDGKGPSTWDNFTHSFPDKILDRSNGDIAQDFYHRYKEDVQLMKVLGLDAFRFSISWSRILPRGKLDGGINKKGVSFYNNLINELLAKGIQPFVTIFHWDLPQALEDEYSGFLSPLIVDDFVDFAELCFKLFGDRVKHWITINEPYVFTSSYDSGSLAPGRCSPWMSNNCPAGNSATEPYIAAHHVLLCHAATVKLYKEKYQASQKGEIGITQVSHWFVPYSTKKQDVEAAQRALDFMYGWFVHPLIHGEYPPSMKKIVKDRMPDFTTEQAISLKGSFDFLGLNYYTSNYAAHGLKKAVNISSSTDSQTVLTTVKNGKPIGDPTGVNIFFVYPKGLEDLLVYTKEKYNNPTIYITENGMGDSNKSMKEYINDWQRVDFYYRHLSAIQNAIRKGVKVKGFLLWSFLDTFEWGSGYTMKFGICYVDYENKGLRRYPKQSALWFKKWLN